MVMSSRDSSCDDENPFKLIERGNAMAASGNLWSAADAFGRASVALRREAGLVVSQLEEAKDVGPPPASKKKWHEQRKIAELYLDQSRDYLYRGRGCLLTALNSENDQDRERMNLSTSNQGPVGRAFLRDELEPLVIMISPEEKERRLRIFRRLFVMSKETLVSEEEESGTMKRAPDANPSDEIGAATKKEADLKPPDEDDTGQDAKPRAETRSEHEPDVKEGTEEETKEQLDAKREVLEKRLSQFESTLPERCKSEKERISDLHKRMKKMGLSVPDEEKRKGAFDLDFPTPSEEEQVRRIMEQAQDEVKLAGGTDAPEENDAASDGNDISGGDDEILIVNDDDDLNDILRKAGMTTAADASAGGEKMAKEGGETTERLTSTDATKMLSLIETAQGLLFEASAHLEDAAAGGDSESEPEDENDGLGSKGDAAQTEGIQRGKASLIKAKKCIEAIVGRLPPSRS